MRQASNSNWRHTPLAHFPFHATLALAIVAIAATSASGILSLATHAKTTDVEHVMAPTGIILLVLSAVQAWLIVSAWNCNQLREWRSPGSLLRFGRGLLLCAFAAYLLALAIGPIPGIVFVWVAGVAIGVTLLLLPLAAPAATAEHWRQWTSGRGSRRLTWLVTAATLLVIAAEAGLRLDEMAVTPLDSPPLAKAANNSPFDATGASFAQLSNDPAISQAQLITGPFRIALVGDVADAGGTEPGGCWTRVQRMSPRLEIVSVHAPVGQACKRSLAAQLRDKQYDLVIVVLNVCEDLSLPLADASWFDWRQLELAEHIAPAGSLVSTNAQRQVAAGDERLETILDRVAPQLAACRTPIDAPMQARWRRTLQWVDSLGRACRSQELPLAIVLVPGSFQVNASLRQTLARRCGYEAQQIDVDLPQRKLTSFAAGRHLPVIDLLPALRLCATSPYDRNTHWNEEGHSAVAAAIGGWLDSSYGSQLRSAAQLTSAP